MNLPDEVWETFVAVVNKFPHKNSDGTSSDEFRRAQMKKAVSTVRARHGDHWTTKTEHNTPDIWSAQSADALCYVPEVPIHAQRMNMYIWDLINGITFEPMYNPESEDLRPAFVLIPETKDWLRNEDEPGPDPIPIPIPTTGIQELLAAIISNQIIQHELLSSIVATMQEQTSQLKAATNELRSEIAKGVLVRFR